jgi:hypothetical protein
MLWYLERRICRESLLTKPSLQEGAPKANLRQVRRRDLPDRSILYFRRLQLTRVGKLLV